MTGRLPFTKASLRRRIEAAREVGLKVTEIRPDGTLVVVEHGDNDGPPVVDVRDNQSKWASAKQ